MGAEPVWLQRARTPSRLSNCGEMVAESVLEQLERELRLEAELQEHPPGGRTLLVGMKLNATCREMLAWTIVDLARPGDHIVAFHVASFPLHSVTTSREYDDHFEQLANTLRGFLTIYEGLCILKQIKLEVEILPGLEVRKAMVDFAKSHKTCELILGSNKHFTVRRNKSLGRYCLKRLPYTCTVVVLQHGEIILNEKGKLHRRDITRIGAGVIRSLRRSMRSFGRSKKAMMMMSAGGSWDGSEGPPRRSEASSFCTGCYELEMSKDDFQSPVIEHSAELERCYFSDSSLFHSSLIYEFTNNNSEDTASSRRLDPLLPIEGSSPSFISTTTTTTEEAVTPGWPLMHQTIGFDKVKPVFESFSADDDEFVHRPRLPASSPLHRHSVDKAARSRHRIERLASKMKVKGARSPIHRLFAEDTTTTRAASAETTPASKARRIDPSQIVLPVPIRHMSVVDWALQLPHRSARSGDDDRTQNNNKVVPPECKADYAELLSVIARDAFRAAANDDDDDDDDGSCTDDHESTFFRANKKVKFSLERPLKNGDWNDNLHLPLSLKLDSLGSLDRKCRAFHFDELKAATSCFSSNNVVGVGGGSEVYKGTMADGKLVAVKRLNNGPRAEEELLNDVAINTSLACHPHIVTLLGYCVHSSRLLLVYNYLPEGNLEERLHASGTKSIVLPWRVRYKAAMGTAKALDYLHHGTSRPVIHRDVKTSNILFTADFESQLSDFGLAKWAPKKASHILCDDILGTFGYLAPEYFMYGRVNNKTDVYAFGVVLLELITGRPPIDNTKPKGHENLVNWARPLLKDNNLNELVDPRLEGAYDVQQMRRLLHAASLCIRQSSHRRPQMSRVLQILCSSNYNRPQPAVRPRSYVALDREDSSSIDLEDCEVAISETPTLNGGGGGGGDIKTHIALAMLGVDQDDDNNSNSNSSLDHRGGDRLHSSRYLEAYLERRYSPSSSFVK